MWTPFLYVTEAHLIVIYARVCIVITAGRSPGSYTTCAYFSSRLPLPIWLKRPIDGSTQFWNCFVALQYLHFPRDSGPSAGWITQKWEQVAVVVIYPPLLD